MLFLVNEPAVLNSVWVDSVVRDSKVVIAELEDVSIALGDNFKSAIKQKLLKFELATPPIIFPLFKTTMCFAIGTVTQSGSCRAAPERGTGDIYSTLFIVEIRTFGNLRCRIKFDEPLVILTKRPGSSQRTCFVSSA